MAGEMQRTEGTTKYTKNTKGAGRLRAGRGVRDKADDFEFEGDALEFDDGYGARSSEEFRVRSAE
jgi:hypothetical protein